MLVVFPVIDGFSFIGDAGFLNVVADFSNVVTDFFDVTCHGGSARGYLADVDVHFFLV